MAIDKSWTTLRRRNSDEFWNGLQEFMEIAKEHVNSSGFVRCPCTRCLNMLSQKPDVVEAHIHAYGWQASYTTWVYHGEVDPLHVIEDEGPTTDEMIGAINDVIGENINNEEHVDEGIPDGGANGIDQEYAELFQEVETELYPSCTWLSSLNFLAKMLHMKVMNKWTDSSFDQLLEFLKFALPKDNKVPASYYDAKKKMRKIGLGYQPIHVCKNDCCLFWKENESMQTCPVCGDSRWVDKNTKGKKVPQKVLRYFPLTPRLKRLYSSRHTAKDMTWHTNGRSTEDGIMRHPVDGSAWKDFDTRYPEFANEPRNVRLGLAADGFNPFGNMSQSYSMWPVILTTYNTPPWLCMKESSFMLTLLIPGPKSPGKDMDVFLRPLVDELKMLWGEGVQTRDAVTNSIFTMRAALLWTINDFPARSSLSGWSGQGYKACPTCNEDTPSCRVVGKTAYVGHRRFLSSTHRWRKSKLFDGNLEKRHPPRRFSRVAILEQLAHIPIRLPGKHPSFGGMKRKRDPNELNWTKRSIFFELEYWSFLELKHNLDVMHVEKNVCDSLLGTLLMNDKSKDTSNARVDLKDLGIRKELWLQEKDNKIIKPHAKYSFTTDDRRRFCQFIKGVKLPDGFGSNFRKKVTDNDTNIVGLKSHDCHILMQRLLPVGVRGCLDDDIVAPIFELCTFFKQICARTLVVDDMKKAQDQLIMILCKLELIFPPAFFDIMIHLVLHLPEEAILGGPVYMRWMYPFERYMKKLKNYVRNKAKPEGSIAEGYVADEALTFCSMYLQGIQTRFNRPDRNEDVVVHKRQLSVFESQCRPTSASKIIFLKTPDRKAMEWFVLYNCPEIQVYMDQFHSEMQGSNLQNEFPSWFNKKMCNLRQAASPECTDELFSLAHGTNFNAHSYTGCIVNGVRFVVRSRDMQRTTQNSGVAVPGVDGFTFYGQLEEILELRYLNGYSVVLFRCKWFNTDPRKGRCVIKNNVTSINISSEWYKDDPYILATQAKQVFYIEDLSRNRNWRVVEDVNHRKIWDHPSIKDVNEIDVIHDNSSSNFVLNSDLGELPNTSCEDLQKDVKWGFCWKNKKRVKMSKGGGIVY
ncbi:hypothetical protein OSB04_022758 [Centaurea solstitialis]|uniref:Transposase n=1 Tax=Centaurea solstitialis TaxID=347529 RepID=A0AA38WC88_9ASTR|nr:hypothetical protein OSB04_022758 [Centaurea solstitialis]